jgi:hypothetical protein
MADEAPNGCQCRLDPWMRNRLLNCACRLRPGLVSQAARGGDEGREFT